MRRPSASCRIIWMPCTGSRISCWRRKPSPARNLWICCIRANKRKPLSLRERLFLFELRMSLSLREFRPRRDEISRIARLFNYRPSGGIIHFPFSILNYFHRNVKISAGCSNLRSDVSFSASEHPHRARTLLTPALLAHCISYSLSPI